ncbi:MAG: MOSC domain-containing protein [Deltaproteobacteria bacterium]|nr:MOSC domain-containing protein [Deltaproteobacteria bacterium]
MSGSASTSPSRSPSPSPSPSPAQSLRLAEIHVYPLKGARGITLERAEVRITGLAHDRRFMILGDDGRFVTQREEPRLALLETAIRGDELVLSAPGCGDAALPLLPHTEGLPRRAVNVFDDATFAVAIEGPANDLVSRHLGRAVTIVFMPDDVERPVESPYGAPGDRVFFADAYPVLLATRASLAELNGRLTTPLPMNRFRPNLVVEGGEAWEEERFGRARVGALSLRMPKRCSRCSVTTVDQATAEVGKEPLRTLATYRAESNKVYFAQNAIPDAPATIAIGDEVAYLDPKP